MKRIIFLTLLLVGVIGTVESRHQPDFHVSFGFFYSSLAPHGEWLELHPGFYVWRPVHVRHHWRPYMHGRWVWTRYGWYWVSYEPFGWIVFHYGRWYYDDYYGWIWIPGYEWGPAWVEWRYSDDYIGWAPLPPYAHFEFSIGIRWTRRWVSPVHYWVFVPCRYFTSPRFTSYVVPVERTQRIFGSTRTATYYDTREGRVFNRGVDVGFVERRGGSRVERADIVETRERQEERVVRQGGRTRIEVYRPDRSEVESTTPGRIDARRAERPSSLEFGKIEMNRPSDDRGTRARQDREVAPPTSTPQPPPAARERDRQRSPEREIRQPDRKEQREPQPEERARERRRESEKRESDNRKPENVRQREERRSPHQPQDQRAIREQTPRAERSDARNPARSDSPRQR